MSRFTHVEMRSTYLHQIEELSERLDELTLTSSIADMALRPPQLKLDIIYGTPGAKIPYPKRELVCQIDLLEKKE